MALTATLYRFQIELADIDNNVYESLDLRVAQHPSEDEERMVMRVLARAIAHEEGLEFGRGLSNVEDPALWTQSPTGEVLTWIDIGVPSADRLHRAAKRAGRVLVFTHKIEASLQKEWSSRVVHKADEIQVFRLPVQFVRDLVDSLDRTVTWYVTLQDGQLSVAHGDKNSQCPLAPVSLAEFVAVGD